MPNIEELLCNNGIIVPSVYDLYKKEDKKNMIMQEEWYNLDIETQLKIISELKELDVKINKIKIIRKYPNVLLTILIFLFLLSCIVFGAIVPFISLFFTIPLSIIMQILENNVILECTETKLLLFKLSSYNLKLINKIFDNYKQELPKYLKNKFF